MSRVVRSLVFVMVLSSAGSASFLPNFVQGAEFRLHAIHASAFDFFGRLFRICRHRRDLATPSTSKSCGPQQGARIRSAGRSYRTKPTIPL